MEHLSFEEITKYVEANKASEETFSLIAKVNNHIRECNECGEKVTAFERVYDMIRVSALENEDVSMDSAPLLDLLKNDMSQLWQDGLKMELTK